jgi:hypothetical protein
MTTKQKEYIEFIEEFSGVRFKGNPNSNKDISEYINNNKEKAKLASTDNWAIINGY